jgi:hypothetical protein
MIALRILGGIVAVALLVLAAVRYRRRAVSRLSLIVTWLIGTAIVLLAVDPDLFDPLFNLFNFRAGGGQRLIGVLLLSTLALFLLMFTNMSRTDEAARSIRLLVEALAVQTFDRSQVASIPPGRRVLVIMPAHNEAENVSAVIHAIPEGFDGYRVIPVVVDDASEDGTPDVARRSGALVARLPIRRGGGLALRVGYELALTLDAAIVVTMDADGQHVPEEMPLLVKPILEDQADLVNGSRVLGAFERESVVRHMGVHFFSWLVTLMTGSRITDVSNGYRAVRLDVLKRLTLDQDQFWASELLIEGMRHRLRIREVPITIRARAGGTSKKPKTVKYAWKFTKAIVQTWLR